METARGPNALWTTRSAPLHALGPSRLLKRLAAALVESFRPELH